MSWLKHQMVVFNPQWFTNKGNTCPLDQILGHHPPHFPCDTWIQYEELDMSTARRRQKSPGHYLVHQPHQATKFHNDWMTSEFLFINATAATLGQGHANVIQYIFQDLYFLCPKYLRFCSNGFDVRSKSPWGGGGRGGGNELKTQSNTCGPFY